MPANKDLKRLIRARMARTGESYSTARRHTLAQSARRGPSAGGEGDRMLRTRFETGIEDGRRVVAAFDVPADDADSLLLGLEFGVVFAADAERRRYVWEYPADAPGWSDAARNWVDDGPRMLDQKHGVLPADWEAGLAWIADVLNGIGADWFVIGSVALALRGMDVRPGGVDVALDEASADRVAPHVGAAVLRPVIDTRGWPVATRSGLLFRDSTISVVGGMHDQGWPRPWDSAARASLETITWENRSIRVPPLGAMLGQARAMSRNDHVRAILSHNARRT